MNKWVAFFLALLLWAAFFYSADRYIMHIQGLPVKASLMPAS